MVVLTRDADGRVRARLLDLVPGRSGETYRGWLRGRGEDFRSRVQQETTGHRGRRHDRSTGPGTSCEPAARTSPTGSPPSCRRR